MHPFDRRILMLFFAAFSLIFTTTTAFDPITLAGGLIAVSGASIFSVWQLAKCKYWECCKEPWLFSDIGSGRVLRSALEKRVYGQHIAIDIITENVRNHVSSRPTKPLVLSFHGGTGVGKNHISRVIAETMFKKGMNSQFVHLIISTLHFPIAGQASQYRIMLQNWIRGNLTKCSRNLFIFDEVDKIPAGVLDGMSSYLDYYGTEVDGVDPREAIFIFLSNTGTSQIDEIAWNAWVLGRTRESLTIFDFQRALQIAAINEAVDAGLYHSNVIKHELIDIYVPFLPLERRHVEACVRDYLRENNYTIVDEVVGTVAGELDYGPSPDSLFSVTGCKRIRERAVSHILTLKKLARQQMQIAEDNPPEPPEF